MSTNPLSTHPDELKDDLDRFAARQFYADVRNANPADIPELEKRVKALEAPSAKVSDLVKATRDLDLAKRAAAIQPHFGGAR